MSEIAIRCEGLSKRYRLGQQERYKALRDVIADAAAAPFRLIRSAMSNGNGSSSQNPQSEIRNSFWALQDVSFEVKRGEVVGIIGRNGAGKSTLLKILSRITKPTKGHAEIHGRVGSLLEVGTGFHPELTGRENIYLNAAILGMRKSEVEQKFDEIVAFAEVEKFIETPVKRYSSGMYVRLAFAVAAHMETEVLLVDEVLAVGDAAFQKKCIGKMGDVAKEGRTVLFVSHNMTAVQALCPRGVLLDGGHVTLDGDCARIIEDYLTRSAKTTAAVTDLSTHPNRHQGCQRILSAVRIMNSAGELSSRLYPGDELILEIDLDSPFAINEPTLGVGVDNALGARIFSLMTYFSDSSWPKLEGLTTVRCTVPAVSLVPGRYLMSLSAGDTYNQLMDAIPHAASFTIEPNDYFGSGRLPTPDLGVLLARSRWEFGVEK
jgi:lipopolysaccharide transport system ATP-binding protein